MDLKHYSYYVVLLTGIPIFLLRTKLWILIAVIISFYYVTKKIYKHLCGQLVMEGKAVLITGCDTGFGHDLAKLLDSLGCIVFAGCLQVTGSGAKELKNNGSRRLYVFAMDVGSNDSVNKSLSYVQKHCPNDGLWAIVNNAGFNVMGDVEFLGVKFYHKAMNVNFYGTARVTRAFLYLVRRQKGRVINMSSGRGRFSFPRDSAYHVSKHCQETFSDSLRMEMRKFGIRVSVIEPGHYGAATACQDHVQFSRYKNELEDMWDNSTPEMKQTYGEYYLESLLDAQATSLKTSAPNTDPVMVAMLDAMFSSCPDPRYLVSGGNSWFDKSPTFVKFHPFLPDWLSDYILKRWTKCDIMPQK